MNVYSFEKTLGERLIEYTETLKYSEEPLPASKIRSEWADFLEIEMEPSGWQAIWKMPRNLCEEFKIHYPNLLLVTVKGICYKLLIATVSVIGVQDDNIHLPETLEAELIELWPTKQQEFDTLDMYRMANCIDKFRFFYNNIWMPWDMYSDDSIDWTEEHLKPRLDLYFALHSGAIREPRCSYIKGIIKEAKTLQAAKNSIENELSENEEEEPNDPKTAKRLIQIHLRLKYLQEQVELCENNEMRDLLDVSGLAGTSQELCIEPEIYFISQKCSIDDHLRYVNKAKDFIPSDCSLQFCQNLETVLDSCGNDDTIIISPGTYVLQSMIKLKDVCTVKGIFSPSETTLKTTIENSYFFSTFKHVVIENITIDAKNLQYAIMSAYGTLHLKNCIIVGDGKSVTRRGICISSNSCVEAEYCEINNFGTGILCNKESKLVLRECIIQDCMWGIQVFPGCHVSLNNSCIKDCKENGVYVTDDNLSEATGDCNILEELNGFEITSTSIVNSKHANVIIRKTLQFHDFTGCEDESKILKEPQNDEIMNED